jgi:hypothetical protein
VNGNLELVAALAVNVPGFAIVASLLASGQDPYPDLRPLLTRRDNHAVSLIASGGVAELARMVSRRATTASMADLDRIVASHSALATEVAELRSIVSALHPAIRAAAQERLTR